MRRFLGCQFWECVGLERCGSLLFLVSGGFDLRPEQGISGGGGLFVGRGGWRGGVRWLRCFALSRFFSSRGAFSVSLWGNNRG